MCRQRIILDVIFDGQTIFHEFHYLAVQARDSAPLELSLFVSIVGLAQRFPIIGDAIVT